MTHLASSLARTAALAAVVSTAGGGYADTTVDFVRDIRPILADSCFACHGPDASNRRADLRLDRRDDAVASGAIVPGDPAASSLVARITSTDPDAVMPPPDSHKRLDAAHRRLLVRWIEEGAGYRDHWAYVPPLRPDVPRGAGAIDHLVGLRLASLGLEPVGEADRRTLIRRLSVDLTGLPPTPDEVDSFLADPAEDAYAALVERLLASPHFGERMAIGWLDVVRFADTIGYHSDTPRNIWPYRDWVIRSFNANKPFDRFTVEQIAGDLLPDASLESRVGSAFNRLLLTTEEGGAQEKDYEARMLTDRVRAVGAVWLGQTTGCAACHDHKFDPLTMRDFYSLGAFFADLQEPAVGRREDGIPVPSEHDSLRLAELAEAEAAATRALEAVTPRLDAAQADWERTLASSDGTLPELLPGAEPAAGERRAAEAAAAGLRKDVADRDAADLEAIRGYFRTRVEPLLHRAERDAAAEAARRRREFEASLPRCLVSSTKATASVVRILPRGNWMDESGPVVTPAFPAFLPAPAIVGRLPNRLDLARWLVSRDNPLTPRVVMNRLWRQFFGTGLSRVLDDLGAQGEPPANPALLDWLACEFVDSGWDVRHMVRTIVSSRAYRRSSVPTRRLLAADPLNREFGRQSSWRLDAELVRDSSLAASGLLDRTIGGPSVKPYQPAGYWENLNFPPRTYSADGAATQHRRGIYTWWQRSFLHPAMLAFDAPTREECCADRGRSTVPQQALVLLNDPSHVEAARVLAARLARECGGSPEERLAGAFRLVLQRPPRSEEIDVLVPLYRRQLAAYRADPDAARGLLGVGLVPAPEGVEPADLAAWTHVARVLLNLHETITRS